MNESWMVLVAGPYRSGTGDDPKKMEENLRRLEAAALEVWNRGHLPVIGEWLALPLVRRAGSTAVGDLIWKSLVYPVADRLIARCDAILRLPGDSKGADGDVVQAGIWGLPVLTAVDQLPVGVPRPGRSS